MKSDLKLKITPSVDRKKTTMTLWTPYVEEVAMDLSKGKIKEDYGNLDRFSPQHFHYPAYITYPQPMYAPVSQISPVSGGSISSYDSCTRLHDQARYHTRLTHPDLSPPVSPMLDRPLKRSYNTVDVDYLSDDPDFQTFKCDALRAMAERNGGSLLGMCYSFSGIYVFLINISYWVFDF